MAGSYTSDTFTITNACQIRGPQESFWFSFSQNDIECWEPGRVMYVTLIEGACLILKLTFQLFVSTFFTCSTHSVEIHENGIQKHTSSNSVSMHL